jgi:hypothetical protein
LPNSLHKISALAGALLSALRPKTTVASQLSQGVPAGPQVMRTQRNGMHTVICAGRDRHCSHNVRRSQSGRPRLGVPPDLRLTADKPHE